MNKQEIEREALKIRFVWVCKYGEKNAKKLSLQMRRLFRKE